MKQALAVCNGQAPADVVIRNGQVVNVFTHELITADVAILDGQIVGIGGPFLAQTEVDATGKIIAPGFIDSHVHIESGMITPVEFARTVIPCGTTTLIADPHEIANVCGLAGIRFMIENSQKAPANIYFMLPSCVPCTPMETSGATLNAEDLAELVDHPSILGLGEVMDFPGVISGREDVLQKLILCDQGVVDGHAPGLTGTELAAYALAGVNTDHECSTTAEAIERFRLGMTVQIRKGSAADNLRGIVPGLIESGLPLTNCVFCTDDKHLEDIIHEGHINANIRESIALGLDPLEAIAMATLYPARVYGLKKKGAIAPGFDADLVILDDLSQIEVCGVMVAGQWQVRDRVLLHRSEATVLGAETLQKTMQVECLNATDFVLPITSEKVHVMGLIPEEILTQKLIESVPVENGLFKADGEYAKIAVIERHHGTGRKATAIVKGFGITNGAIAQTIAHDSHNLLVIGDSDEAMALAANTVIANQGGIAVVHDGQVTGQLALPIGGLMTELSAPEMIAALEKLLEAAKALKINDGFDPFLTLAFLALPVIPEIKITDFGLFDVKSFSHIPLAAD